MDPNITCKRIKMRREALGMSQEDLATLMGYNSRSTITKIETGTNKIKISMVEAFSRVLHTSPSYLMGWVDDPELTHEQTLGLGKKYVTDSQTQEYTVTYPNILPMETKTIPLLGSVACGEPIYAPEDANVYVTADSHIGADFALKAVGDSMVNARIYDGDIVFIKSQPAVDSGEIAAVSIDNEVTLKRVYYYQNESKLVLTPENPMYAPMVFTGSELDTIRILGKAVAFQSVIK